jgi:FAD binding domain in molybdopterin dehydrogenase
MTDVMRADGGLRRRAAAMRPGPMVTIRRMETDPLVARIAPLAAAAYGKVANPRVRHQASAGGNLAYEAYQLDPPAAPLAFGAVVEAPGPELRAPAAVSSRPLRRLHGGRGAGLVWRPEATAVIGSPMSVAAGRFETRGVNGLTAWLGRISCRLIVPVRPFSWRA